MKTIPPQSLSYDRPLAVFLARTPTDRPWRLDSWRLVGVVPDREGAAIDPPDTGLNNLFRWGGLNLTLHAKHCAAYYDNLRAGQPKLFVICHWQDRCPQPVVVSADADEAAAYMETDAPVFSCPLPDYLGAFLESYVVENYRPEPPQQKRRRNRSLDQE